MYEAFEGFIDDDSTHWNWHTNHPNDDERFYLRLNKALQMPDFSPDEMGEHFRQRLQRHTNEPNECLLNRIAELVSKAWTIKEYLKATNQSYL